MTYAEKIIAEADRINAEAEKVKGIYEAGAKSEYDLFWDNYQSNGTRTNYSYCFYTSNWTEKTFRPKYKLVPTNINNAFRNMNVPDFYNACDLDTSKCTDVKFAFAGAGHKHIGIIDLSSCTGANTNGLFSGATNLRTVDKLIWNEHITTGDPFYNCSSLRNVVMEGTIACNFQAFYSRSLSRASIESIINTLSPTTGYTLTLSQVAVNSAFETAEGLKDGSTSQEWEDLIATKSNWTISLRN